jgi:hypothetical protein
MLNFVNNKITVSDVVVKRPTILYDKDTYTVLKLGEYDLICGIHDKYKQVANGHFDLEILEFINVEADEIEKVYHDSGYLRRFLKNSNADC